MKLFTPLLIAVPAQKILGGNEVLPKFCDVCPNHDFIVHFGYDKKMSEILGRKTNFVLKSW